jgi:alpha-methylacyl-CoA racemase
MAPAARKPSGPLSGMRIVEFAGIGPGPFCGMLLSDLGADVICIDRAGYVSDEQVTRRGRRSVVLDLKKPDDRETCLRLLEKAEAAFEGFRPGVMERLGLGPEVVLKRNPRLVYGRMTGWGQSGPYSHAAGHDINYIAITGALHAIGLPDKPVPPLNLVGDFGGGALYLAFGLLAGILNARATGQGQVIDCAVTDGTASLMSMMWGFRGNGEWRDARVANMLDGGAPFYGTYQCADGLWITLGSIEAKFYEEFLKRAGITDPEFADRMNRERWPALREKFAQIVAARTRAEWCALLEGTDVCFAPVMSLAEAPQHPHNVARGTYVNVHGIVQPAPVPRFSQTPGAIQRPAPKAGEHTEAVLREWGVSAPGVDAIARRG